MTEHEQAVLSDLTAQMNGLTLAVNGLTTRLEVSLKGEEACRCEVRALHVVLFGIDGDRANPGLQRIVDEHGRRLDQHDQALADLHDRGNWWKNNIWTLVTVGGITFGGAILNAWFLHLWK